MKKFQLVDVEQGSKEWFAFRKGKITASIVANCIGVKGAFRSIKEQALISKGLKEAYFSAAQIQKMQKGLDKESEILDKASEYYKDVIYRDVVLQSLENPLFAASLDGRSLRNESIFYEFKYSKFEYDFVKNEKKPSEKYFAQIQFILYITGFEECRFVVMNPEDESIVCLEVAPDLSYQAVMLGKIKHFVDEYLHKDISPEPDELQDIESLELATELKELLEEVADKNERIAQLKASLAKKGEEFGSKCYVSGVCIYPSTRTSVDYKGFLKDKKLEVPSEFIKESVSWSVKV